MNIRVIALIVLLSVASCNQEQQTKSIHTAKAELASSRLRIIKQALAFHKAKHGNYPSTEDGLKTLRHKHDDGPQFDMSNETLTDPWGNPFVYRLTAPESFILKSIGPDGKDGTSDDIQ